MSDYNYEIDKKYYNKINDNTYIEKTAEEKLNEDLITKEEYNEIINKKREALYQSTTDKQVMELMRNFLNKNKTKLQEESRTKLDNINTQIESIKKENPKQE